MTSLDIVLPCYEDGEILLSLLPSVEEALSVFELNLRFIIVDDGSTRAIDSRHLLVSSRVLLIRIPENFGHQFALRAGLEASDAEFVASMDSDGQHPPAVLAEMVEIAIREFRSVVTRRIRTLDISAQKRLFSFLFYNFYALFTGIRITSGSSDFRILTKSDKHLVLSDHPRSSFWRGKVANLIQPSVVDFAADDRLLGKSRFTVRKMMELAFIGIHYSPKRSRSLIRGLRIFFIGLIIFLGFLPNYDYWKWSGAVTIGVTMLFKLQLFDFYMWRKINLIEEKSKAFDSLKGNFIIESR